MIFIELEWSGREDSNLRPPAPKAGALAKLRYAPKTIYYMITKRKIKQMKFYAGLFVTTVLHEIHSGQ